MEIYDLILDKIALSLSLFSDFCKQFRVSNMSEYYWQRLPRKGEFLDSEKKIVSFHIHGKDIDFITSNRKIICDIRSNLINFELFNVYTIYAFTQSTETPTNYEILYNIQDSLDDLEKIKKIRRVNDIESMGTYEIVK